MRFSAKLVLLALAASLGTAAAAPRPATKGAAAKGAKPPDVAADGKDPRPVTAGKDAYVRGPVWTPDGDYLVGRREDGKRAGLPPVELWMYHLHGGGGIKVTSSDDLDAATGPVASRDGRYLYFS